MWRAIYRTDNGRLLSVASIWTDPPRPGTSFKEYVDRPDQGENMWDEVALDWIPRPPQVLIDRWDDLLADPEFADGHAKIPQPFRKAVEASIKRLLGAERFRLESESVEIGR